VLSKNKKYVPLVLLMLLLTVIIFGPVIVSAAPSADQIVIQGRARYYNIVGAEVAGAPVLGGNAIVSVEKGIAATNLENEFDITLNIKTSVNVSEVKMSADAAVVLVLDISNSMGGINDANTDYMPALRASAQNFVNDLAAEAGDAARYVSLVTFATNAKIVYGWTDITNPLNRAAVNSYIQGLKVDGGTFMQGGLLLARNLMRTDALPRGRNNQIIENRSVILFSDGEANYYTNSANQAGYSTGVMVPQTGGPGNTFDEISKVYANLMADTVKSQTAFSGYQKHTAYLYTIAFGSAAPVDWMRNNIATNPTYAYTADNASELNKVFAAIVKRIESWAEAWVVTDPMGQNIEFLSTIPPNDLASGLFSFHNDVLAWDLKKAVADSFINDIYTYTYTYRIGLDTTKNTYIPGVTYPTNGKTELTYVIIEDARIVSDVLIADFAIPAVKGYGGGALAFTKVGDNTTPLAGCQFTLTNQGKANHVLTAASAVAGDVNFTNIPSGHSYTLAEYSMPAAYEGLYLKSGETYTVTVSQGQVTVADSSGNPVDILSFKFNNPSEGRTITGLVSPMAVNDRGLAGFLQRHDVVVELRPTFKTPATAALSTKAVLLNNDGLGQFTFENVPLGTYVLYIKRPGYLARPMMVIVSALDPPVIKLEPPGAADKGIFNLWWGDCNGDGRIDNEDILMVMELLNLRINAFDPLYNPACDLNADGLIDNEDILMVLDPGMWNKIILDYPGASDVDVFI